LAASTGRKRKVAHLTSVHHPGDTRIAHKECRSLIEAGYSVTLVAPGPAAPLVDGIRFRSVRGSGRRLARVTLTVGRVLATALRERADVYHLHDPELIPAGLVMKALGKRVIYDAHEHLPRQIMDKDWIPTPLRRCAVLVADLLEGAADRWFDAIVVANPSTLDRFRRDHTVLVENLARVDGVSAEDPIPWSTRTVAAAYVGGLTEHRGLWQMLDAARLLDRPNSVVVLAGPLDPALESAAVTDRVRAGRTPVQLPGRIGRGEADMLMRDAKVGLSVLQPVPNFTTGHYPTKLFEYMVAATPVVASDFPLYRSTVEAAQCGLVVDPTDAKAIAKAIEYLLDHPEEAAAMGRHGRDAALARFTWSSAEANLLSVYGDVLR
jgi:glycosyltransferase involved in cell wall biosynthesis